MAYTLSKSRKQTLLSRDDYRCQYCGVFLTDSNFSVDHIIPKSLGGDNSLENTRCCCRTCNVKKGTHSIEMFRLQVAISRSKYAGLVTATKLRTLESVGAIFPEIPLIKFHFEEEK